MKKRGLWLFARFTGFAMVAAMLGFAWQAHQPAMADPVSRLPQPEQAAIRSVLGGWKLIKGDHDCDGVVLIDNESDRVTVHAARFNEGGGIVDEHPLTSLSVLNDQGKTESPHCSFGSCSLGLTEWGYLKRKDGYLYSQSRTFDEDIPFIRKTISTRTFAFKRLDNGVLHTFRKFQDDKVVDVTHCYYEQIRDGLFRP